MDLLSELTFPWEPFDSLLRQVARMANRARRAARVWREPLARIFWRVEAEALTKLEKELREYWDKECASGDADKLLMQLRLRFGRVPATVVARLRRASRQQLDRWGDRLLTARTLTAVFSRACSAPRARRTRSVRS